MAAADSGARPQQLRVQRAARSPHPPDRASRLLRGHSDGELGNALGRTVRRPVIAEPPQQSRRARSGYQRNPHTQSLRQQADIRRRRASAQITGAARSLASLVRGRLLGRWVSGIGRTH